MAESESKKPLDAALGAFDRSNLWVDYTIVPKLEQRPGDVIISSTSKNGSSWAVNLVYQVTRQGNTDFEDIFEEVPWLELVEYPGQTQQELLDRWAALPSPRIFKTHWGPPLLPVQPETKYFILVRNPKDAVVSFWKFIHQHTPEFYRMWDRIDENGKSKNNPFLMDRLEDFALRLYCPSRLWWQFVKAWWPLRHQPNVCLMHFADFKREPEQCIRKLASFLEVDVPEDRWPRVLEYTSFQWMKENGRKFEIPKMCQGVKVIADGGMVRRGQTAGFNSDEQEFTQAMHDAFEAADKECFTDDRVRRWAYEGGELPE